MLAHGTAFNVLMYKLYKAWPPEFSGDELTSFEITGVTSSLVVVTAGKDRTMEGILQGNIDLSFVHKDVVIILPV